MRDDQIMHQLRLLDDGPAPDAAFVDRLHDHLASELGLMPVTSMSGGARPSTLSPALGWRGRKASRVRRVAWLAAAAAVLLGIALGAILTAGALLKRDVDLSYTPGSEPASCPRFAPPTMECSFLVVPQDRSDPNSRRIRVFLARMPSTAALPAPDPLVLVEGITESESLWLTTIIPNNPALAQRDLVWVGHRGSGSSNPSLACPEVDAAALARLALDVRSPAVSSAWSAAVATCRDRLVAEGVDVSAYGNDESAADIADARALLGYVSWNLQTYSLPGVVQSVLRDHPAGVRSVVFDSPTPLGGDRFGEARPNLAAALVALQEACTANPSCGARNPDIAGDLARQAQGYETTPADVSVLAPDGSPVRVRIDGARRWEIARWELADNARLAVLPDEFGTSASTSLAETLARMAVAHAIPEADVGYGAVLSLVCRDEVPIADQAAIAGAAVGQPGDGPLVPIPAEVAACGSWRPTPAAANAGSAWTSGVPALIYVGDLDPMAPPSAAASVAAHFASSVTVKAPEGTNRLFASPLDACSRPIRAAFLAAPDVAPDATCLLDARIAFP